MKIVYPKKTGRGLHCSCKGRRVLKRGGYVPLLLSKNLGSGTATVRVESDVSSSDNNVVGGSVGVERLKRITEKVKNIRF
jgi:hypothetical protein